MFVRCHKLSAATTLHCKPCLMHMPHSVSPSAQLLAFCSHSAACASSTTCARLNPQHYQCSCLRSPPHSCAWMLPNQLRRSPVPESTCPGRGCQRFQPVTCTTQGSNDQNAVVSIDTKCAFTYRKHASGTNRAAQWATNRHQSLSPQTPQTHRSQHMTHRYMQNAVHSCAQLPCAQMHSKHTK